MTHQQQAAELIDQFYSMQIDFPYTDTEDGACVATGQMTYKSAVKCALKAVDEIIKAIPEIVIVDGFDELNPVIADWILVKAELEKV